MGGTSLNIVKQNHWPKTLMMKRRFLRQSRKAEFKRNRGKSNESQEGDLKTLYKFSKPYFRAMSQANATLRPNNGAQANTYSSEKLCYCCGKPRHFIKATVRPLYLSKRDNKLSATFYDTYDTSTSGPIETNNPGVDNRNN